MELEMKRISIHTLKRLPRYHQYLLEQQLSGVQKVSAKQIALALELNEVQVRKDIQYVTKSPGKPRTGHITSTLVYEIETFLGYHQTNHACLIGVGHLGKALLNYEGFLEKGLEISVAFDKDETKIDQSIKQIKVLPMSQLKPICNRLKIQLAIITVPSEQAQEVTDLLIESGIKAIWNFAPTTLVVPNDVFVYQEDLSVSFSVVSHHLQKLVTKGDIK